MAKKVKDQDIALESKTGKKNNKIINLLMPGGT